MRGALQREHRHRATDPAFQHDYRTHRPMVERSIVWLHLRIAGLNLRRLLNLGLRNSNGDWVLACRADRYP